MDQQQLNDNEMVLWASVPPSDTVRVRFSEIDGLRALAIIAALVYEATRLASPVATWPPFVARVFSDCGQGLTLFFLISGFVLAYPAFSTLRTDGQTYLDVGRYLVKRGLRIYPAYLLVLALTFIVPPLAMQYGLPALAAGNLGLGWSDFIANVFFVGSGLNNDGFRVLAIEARLFLVFPLLLLLWARYPKVFLGVAGFFALADLILGFAHGLAVGALVPFMLGMIAADVRAGHLRIEKYAFYIAGGAAILAVILEPFLAMFPGPAGAPGALRIDPLWSIAMFGFLLGAGTSSITERALSLKPLSFLGAASYGIALVMLPVSSFVIRQKLSTFGTLVSAANAAIISALAGIVIWQLADRWFSEGNLRRDAADVVGPWLNTLLRFAHADRVPLGSVPEPVVVQREYQEVDPSFYAPPPRPATGDLAVVSMRSGSPEDLAAEIMEMKKRLSDRSSAIFAEAEPEPEPEPEPEAFQKPGFYKRPPGAPTAATPAAATPAPQPPSPPPAAPKPQPRSTAAYTEPTPISIAFEAPAAPSQPAYEHYSFEPPAAPTPPARPAQAATPLPTPGPTTRGPIKMRLAPIPDQSAPPSSNGHHQTGAPDA